MIKEEKILILTIVIGMVVLFYGETIKKFENTDSSENHYIFCKSTMENTTDYLKPQVAVCLIVFGIIKEYTDIYTGGGPSYSDIQANIQGVLDGWFNC